MVLEFLNRESGPAPERLFYEKRVSTFRALIKAVEVLDADSGVRVVGRYGKAKCYAFITRFGDRFTILVYQTRDARGGAMGRLLASKETKGTAELAGLLSEMTKGGVDAYIY